MSLRKKSKQNRTATIELQPISAAPAKPNAQQEKVQKISPLMTLPILLLLLAMAFMARSWVAYDYVFPDSPTATNTSTVRLLGVDPFFHLRHAHYTLTHYPHIQRWDSGTHFPNGIANNAAGLFDVAIATATLAIYNTPYNTPYNTKTSINQVAAVAAWSTPILALLSCICLYWLGKMLLGPVTGLAMVLVFVLYPGESLDRSILGFADHHSAEVLLSLAVAMGLVCLFKQHDQSGKNSQLPWWRPAFLAALPLIILAYTWKGAALIFPVIGPALLLYWTVAVATSANPQRLSQPAIRYGLALLLVFTGVHYLWPELEVFAQGIRWLVIGAAGLTLGSWVYLSLLGQLLKKYGEQQKVTIATGGFFTVMTITAIFLYTTAIGQKIMGVLFEHRSTLIREQFAITFEHFFYRLGSAGLLAAPGFIIGLVMACKRQIPPQTLIPLTMGLMWTLIWWATGDFGYTPPAFLAFCAVTGLYGLYRFIRSSRFGRPVVLASGSVVTLALLISPIYPFKLVATPLFNHTQMAGIIIYEDAWYQALEWLREHSPTPLRTPLSSTTPTTIPITTSNQGKLDYGVMASWDFGNIIASHANRIPIWSRYPSATVPKWSLAQSETESLQWLCPKCNDSQTVRYAIVDAKTFGPFFHAKAKTIGKTLQVETIGSFTAKGQTIPRLSFGQVYDNAIISRLYAKDGSELSHYRLVYESPAQHYIAAFFQLLKRGKFNYQLQALPIMNLAQKQQYQQWVNSDLVLTDDGYLYDDQIQASIKIYQVVAGARVSGGTAPGALVQLRLALTSTTSGRSFNYVRSTVADEKGQYQLTVPYPTEPDNAFSAIFAARPYQLMIRQPDASDYSYQQDIQVTVEQVHQGKSINPSQ